MGIANLLRFLLVTQLLQYSSGAVVLRLVLEPAHNCCALRGELQLEWHAAQIGAWTTESQFTLPARRRSVYFVAKGGEPDELRSVSFLPASSSSWRLLRCEVAPATSEGKESWRTVWPDEGPGSASVVQNETLRLPVRAAGSVTVLRLRTGGPANPSGQQQQQQGGAAVVTLTWKAGRQQRMETFPAPSGSYRQLRCLGGPAEDLLRVEVRHTALVNLSVDVYAAGAEWLPLHLVTATADTALFERRETTLVRIVPSRDAPPTSVTAVFGDGTEHTARSVPAGGGGVVLTFPGVPRELLQVRIASAEWAGAVEVLRPLPGAADPTPSPSAASPGWHRLAEETTRQSYAAGRAAFAAFPDADGRTFLLISSPDGWSFSKGTAVLLLVFDTHRELVTVLMPGPGELSVLWTTGSPHVLRRVVLDDGVRLGSLSVWDPRGMWVPWVLEAEGGYRRRLPTGSPLTPSFGPVAPRSHHPSLTFVSFRTADAPNSSSGGVPTLVFQWVLHGALTMTIDPPPPGEELLLAFSHTFPPEGDLELLTILATGDGGPWQLASIDTADERHLWREMLPRGQLLNLSSRDPYVFRPPPVTPMPTPYPSYAPHPRTGDTEEMWILIGFIVLSAIAFCTTLVLVQRVRTYIRIQDGALQVLNQRGSTGREPYL